MSERMQVYSCSSDFSVCVRVYRLHFYRQQSRFYSLTVCLSNYLEEKF